MAAIDKLPAQRDPQSTDNMVAGFDLIPRELLNLGARKMRALDSLVQKGMRAREGSALDDKYFPGQEFLAHTIDDTNGPVHYRDGGVGFVRPPDRDINRWSKYDDQSRADTSGMMPEAWTMHSHPGGGTLSPADAGFFTNNPLMSHGITETPHGRMKPLKLPEGFATYVGDKQLHPSMEEAQAYLDKTGRGDLPENWMGTYEEFSFPDRPKYNGSGPADLRGTVYEPDFYPHRSAERGTYQVSDEAPWMKDILNNLQRSYPEVPREVLIDDLRRSVLGRMSDGNKTMDYKLATPDPGRFEDVMRAYVDTTGAAKGSLESLK